MTDERLVFTMKFSDETRDLAYNWTPHLADGVTLVGEATITANNGLVIDAHATEGVRTVFRVSGGTGGVCTIDLLIEASSGEFPGQRLYIPVVKRP